jgi:hypothetical protein
MLKPPFFLMKIQYDIFILFLRDLAVCMKIRYIIFYVLPKTRYFNTEFVALQYKNTNRY